MRPRPTTAPRTRLPASLRRARLTAGLTREEAALAAGVSVRTVRNAETPGGPRPTEHTLLRLVRAYTPAHAVIPEDVLARLRAADDVIAAAEWWRDHRTMRTAHALVDAIDEYREVRRG